MILIILLFLLSIIGNVVFILILLNKDKSSLREHKKQLQEIKSLRYTIDRLKNPEPSNPDEVAVAVKRDLERAKSNHDWDDK